MTVAEKKRDKSATGPNTVFRLKSERRGATETLDN
jgi:hypothetical protein